MARHLVYGVGAAFAFEILLPIGIRLSKRILVLDAYAPWLLLLGCYGVIFVAAFIACEPIRIRSGHWRYVHRYPPLWFAAVLAVGLAVAPESAPASMRPLVGVPDWIDWLVIPPTFFAVGAAIALRQVPWAEKRRRRSVSNAPTAEWDWKEFEKWFGNEEPAELDYFNHRPVSARIVQTLLNVSRDQSIALLGPFGSGKTTILDPRDDDKRKSRLNLDEPAGELLRYFRRTSGDTIVVSHTCFRSELLAWTDIPAPETQQSRTVYGRGIHSPQRVEPRERALSSNYAACGPLGRAIGARLSFRRNGLSKRFSVS